MTAYDYDLFVIGGGSGGVRAARIACGFGARVAIAEQDRYGGTCVIRGCIPKKLFVYASEFAHDFADAAGYGWTVPPARFDWSTLVANKDREIDRLSGIYVGMLARLGVEVITGRARVIGPHAVDIGGRHATCGTILVATGSRAFKPNLPGIGHAITSDEAFHLPSLPRRIAIVGGGYIAVEFAGIFRGLGCEVALIHRAAAVLRGFDVDVRRVVTANLADAGVELHLDVEATELSRLPDDNLAVTLSNGRAVIGDQVMMATGRVPATLDMGLEQVGVQLGPTGAVVVNQYSRSSIESIYCVGDATDRINLTPVAIHEGHAFADTVFGGHPRPVDHTWVGSAVFSQPPAATVGLTEEQARQHGPIEVYQSAFRPLRDTLTGKTRKAMMKLIVDCASQRVVGAHMVGNDSPEIIQTLAIAVKMGATKRDLDATMAIHPTTAEEFVLMRTAT